MRRVKRRRNASARARERVWGPLGGTRKSPKRVAGGKKAARTRKRRESATARARRLRSYSWKRARGRKRSLTVKRTRRGLMRSPYSRLGYRKGRKVRVNPRRRRRVFRRGLIQRTLGRWRIQRALPIMLGFAGGITLKPTVQSFIVPKLPITMQEMATKWFGVVTIAAGAALSQMGRRRMTKDAGLGLIVAGLYDVVATNFTKLPFIDFLPTFTPGTVPGATADPAQGMGASIGTGNFTTVGAANISQGMEPEVIGCEDLDDLI